MGIFLAAISGQRLPTACYNRLRTNFGEHLNDTFTRLGRGLEEKETGFGSICLCLVGGHLAEALALVGVRGLAGGGSRIISLVLRVAGTRCACRLDKIDLVAGESDDNVGVCLALELLDP